MISLRLHIFFVQSDLRCVTASFMRRFCFSCASLAGVTLASVGWAQNPPFAKPPPNEPPNKPPSQAATQKQNDPPDYIAAGVIGSIMASKASALAAGGEITWMRYPKGALSDGFGAFLQLSRDVRGLGAKENPKSWHFHLGAQRTLGSLFGYEVGYAFRSQANEFNSVHGLHLGVYASVMLLSVGARFIVPVYASGYPGSGPEFGVVIGSKFGVPVRGGAPDIDSFRFLSGRPLLDSAFKQRVASVMMVDGWVL